MTYTNEELLDLFKEEAKLRPFYMTQSTIDNYVIYINYLLDFLGNKSLLDVTEFDMRNYVKTIDNLSDSTYNCRVSGFKKFYKFLCWHENTAHLIKANPAINLQLSRVNEREVKVPLSNTEKSILLQYAKRSHNKALYAILTTLLNTGMRISECLSITLEQYINRDDNGGMIRLSHTKNHKDREIYLNDECVMAIDEYLNVRVDGEYLFTSQEGNMIDKCNMNKTIKNVARKSGKFDEDRIGKLSMHLCRHTLATDMFDNGLSVEQISKVLGNSINTCGNIYVKATRDNIKSAMAM